MANSDITALTTDNLLVLGAANLFKMDEIDVFMAAYEAWYGRPAELQDIEPGYASYLLNGMVPMWVRSYCRTYVNTDTMKSLASYRHTNDATGKLLRQMIMGLSFVVSMLILVNIV